MDLNLALIQYGLSFLESKGYTKLWTPFFMRREMMSRTAQLEQFDEELYKVGEGGKADPDDVDADAKYLIATSEQPVSAFHANEIFADPANELPKRWGSTILAATRLSEKNLTRELFDPTGTPASPPVSERKRVPTAKTPGASSASTNSKKSNNSASPNPKNRGKNSTG